MITTRQGYDNDIRYRNNNLYSTLNVINGDDGKIDNKIQNHKKNIL